MKYGDGIEPTQLAPSNPSTVGDTDSGAASDGGAVTLPESGYALGPTIGRGGMGEVVAARDQRIGREVALKRLGSAPSADAVARFWREARIQARLDHPAIVPVHELGIDSEGRPFFTMKRLSGQTLAERLRDDRRLQPLLRAFVEVCRAIDFAHARRVVHRDLKPGNIILGEYDEVYVLDWGIARELGDRAAAVRDSGDVVAGATVAGTILGTPGYMAPEQVRGEDVGPPADVYALGAILFEILAHEPLHPSGGSGLAHTTSAPTDSPSRRRPELAIPPELDAVCEAALAAQPEARPTARALADGVQRYLDGDRDLERRRTLAAERLVAATKLLDAGDAESRARAARLANHALALDPESTEAAELVTRLVLEPPPELPRQLVDSLAAAEREQTRRRSHSGAIVYLTALLLLAIAPLFGVRDAAWLMVTYAGLAIAGALYYRSSRTGVVHPLQALTIGLILSISFTRIASPFIVTPLAVCGLTLGMASNHWFVRKPLVLVVSIAVLVLFPIGLEAWGVLDPTWKVVGDSLLTWSVVLDLDAPQKAGVLIGINIAAITVVTAFGLALSRAAHQAARELHIEKWLLRQLIPSLPDRPRR